MKSRIRHSFQSVILTALALATTVLVACGEKPDRSAGRSELERASQLINDAQYSEAIYILDSRIKRDPQELKARVLLASAYAARAGLSLARYTSFVQELANWRNEDDFEFESVDPVIRKIAVYSWQIHAVLKTFDLIPVPKSETAMADLSLAIETLDLAGRLEGGHSLYRALLRVAQFKHSLATKYRLRDPKACALERSELVVWIKLVGGDLEKILTDVAYGSGDANARARHLASAERISEALKATSRTQDKLGDLAKIPFPDSLRKAFGPCD